MLIMQNAFPKLNALIKLLIGQIPLIYSVRAAEPEF